MPHVPPAQLVNGGLIAAFCLGIAIPIRLLMQHDNLTFAILARLRCQRCRGALPRSTYAPVDANIPAAPQPTGRSRSCGEVAVTT